MSTFLSTLRSISVMHNKARRLVMDTNRSSSEPLLNLQSLNILCCVSFVFHLILGNLPKSLQKTPVFISDSAPFNLRSSRKICIPSTPILRSDFKPPFASQRVWNFLPSSIQRYHSVETFKRFRKDNLVKNRTDQLLFSFSSVELITPECFFYDVWFSSLRFDFQASSMGLFSILHFVWLLISIFGCCLYCIFLVSLAMEPFQGEYEYCNSKLYLLVNKTLNFEL